jgi:hypothetical protein
LDFEDMASPYGGGGGERGVRRFSGAAGTIEVDDFKKEFTMNAVFIKMRLSNDFETVIPFWGDKFFPAKA